MIDSRNVSPSAFKGGSWFNPVEKRHNSFKHRGALLLINWGIFFFKCEYAERIQN